MQVVGNQVIVTRAGHVVAVRLITGEVEAAPVVAQQSEVLTRVLFFWRPPVAGVVATLTDVLKNTSTGVLRFRFSNGNEREFTGGAQALSLTDYLDTSPGLAEDILIRKTLVNSPDETNVTTMVGGKCSIDMNANAPVTVTVD